MTTNHLYSSDTEHNSFYHLLLQKYVAFSCQAKTATQLKPGGRETLQGKAKSKHLSAVD